MVEHVGASQIDAYAAQLAGLLDPGGRLLNHGIARLRHGDPEAGAFSERYVFPDAAPLHVSRVLLALERAGFEPTHVEGLRQDYVDTLSEWIARLDASASRPNGSRAASAFVFGASTCAPHATALPRASPRSSKYSRAGRRLRE